MKFIFCENYLGAWRIGNFFSFIVGAPPGCFGVPCCAPLRALHIPCASLDPYSVVCKMYVRPVKMIVHAKNKKPFRLFRNGFLKVQRVYFIKLTCPMYCFASPFRSFVSIFHTYTSSCATSFPSLACPSQPL